MAKRYRSPSGRTAAAVVAPARIAEENDAYTVWRDGLDGDLDVATVRRGGIDRYLVHEDATTSWVGHDPPPQPGRWIVLVVQATPVGIVLCIMVLVGRYTGLLPDGLGWLFLLGIGMVTVGGSGLALKRDPERLLQGTGGGWHEPTVLSGWRPQTAAQLAEVERLADEHGGVVQVRETAGDAVDVLVRHWGRRTHYLVDSSGTTCRVEPSSTYTDASW